MKGNCCCCGVRPLRSPLAAWCVCPWPSRDPKTGSERLWGEEKSVAWCVARGRVKAAGVAALSQEPVVQGPVVTC